MDVIKGESGDKDDIMTKTLPIVTIVGRQNVGKSTLFNALIGEKKAIVDASPGLTRDILTFHVRHGDASFTLSDTPGLDLRDTAGLSRSILENAKRYLERSSVIILLLENPYPASFDLDLADLVRKLSIPTVIAVNKMDHPEDLENMSHFYEMGYSDILPLSALKKKNLDLLLDKITGLLPAKKDAPADPDIKIAIVGRPNSGKSTLLNAFIGYDRSLVSDIPGTTRDAVDEDFLFQGRKIRIIDTAGIRRKSRITEDVDFYSLTRALDSIRKCDVAVHLIDAEAGLTEADKKISDEILKARKPIIIAINKWDVIAKDHKTFEAYRDRVIFQFYRAEDFPILSISAKNRQRIHKLITTALELGEKSRKRIETSKLNRIIADIQKLHRLPLLGDRIKIYYATQIDTVPPQFKFFVNNQELFRKDTVRYLEKFLQKSLDLSGIPIIIQIEGKKKK